MTEVNNITVAPATRNNEKRLRKRKILHDEEIEGGSYIFIVAFEVPLNMLCI